MEHPGREGYKRRMTYLDNLNIEMSVLNWITPSLQLLCSAPMASSSLSVRQGRVRSFRALFLSRVSTLTRDIDITFLSVCPSVRLSVTFWYQMKTA